MANQVAPFRFPAVLWVEDGTAKMVGSEALRLGTQRAVIVCDKGIEQSGLAGRVREHLTREGLAVDIYAKAEPEPSVESADRCGFFVRVEEYDLVVGLGGGSSMDTAKVAAILAVHGGSSRDYFGTGLVPARGLPIILLPTTAGTGAEVTPNAIFKEHPGKIKRGIVSPHIIPDVAIVDPLLTITLPPSITASTGMDALAHAIESFTSKRATSHTDLYALEAIRLIGANLQRAVSEGGDLVARRAMAWASLYAGIAIAHAGTNAVHALAYPLGGRFNIAHGVANAVLLPAVVGFNALGDPAKFAQVARALGASGEDDEELATACAPILDRLSEEIGIPRRLRDLGISEEAVAPMSQGAFEIRRLLHNNPREITAQDIEAIYRTIY